MSDEPKLIQPDMDILRRLAERKTEIAQAPTNLDRTLEERYELQSPTRDT